MKRLLPQIVRTFTSTSLLILVPAGLGVCPPPARGQDGTADRTASVATWDTVWTDETRGREIPVRIYYPAPRRTPAPLIVFSHGLAGSRSSCAYLGTYWAGNGYVAIHVQHPGSDESITRGTVRVRRALSAAYGEAWGAYHRAADLRFVIAQMAALEETGTGPMRLDLSRVGAAGYWDGARAALALAGQSVIGGDGVRYNFREPRVKAVVALSPQIPLDDPQLYGAVAAIEVPCLYIRGDADDSRVGDNRTHHRRIPFDYAGMADQYLVTLFGADHMTAPGHRLRARAANDPIHHALLQRASTLFWDAYLADQTSARRAMSEGRLDAIVGNYGVVERKTVPR